MSKPKVLVADHEANVRRVSSTALRLAGFEVEQSDSGGDALRRLMSTEHRAYDLVVLDVMLPDAASLRSGRRAGIPGVAAPTIFLSGRNAGVNLRGVTSVGDDFLVKPFSAEELVARARVVLQRNGSVDARTRWAVDDLDLDDDEHAVRLRGLEVVLSLTEYSLLRYLMLNQGRVLTRCQILDHVWSYNFSGEHNVVERVVCSLRKKLRTDRPLITTVRGVGYRLN